MIWGNKYMDNMYRLRTWSFCKMEFLAWPGRLLRWLFLPRTLVMFTLSLCVLALHLESSQCPWGLPAMSEVFRGPVVSLLLLLASCHPSWHSFVFLSWEKVKVMGRFHVYVGPSSLPSPVWIERRMWSTREMWAVESKGLLPPVPSAATPGSSKLAIQIAESIQPLFK